MELWRHDLEDRDHEGLDSKLWTLKDTVGIASEDKPYVQKQGNMGDLSDLIMMANEP